jgi:hypothetical protein
MMHINDHLKTTRGLPIMETLVCDPEGTRTPNPQNRNLIFYPLNYGAIIIDPANWWECLMIIDYYKSTAKLEKYSLLNDLAEKEWNIALYYKVNYTI